MAKKASSTGGKASGKSTKSASKSSDKSASGEQSPIDTNLAAQAAAKMLMAKATGALPAGNAPSSTTPRGNSSAFKQMKDSMGKAHLGGIDNMLANTADPAAKKIAPSSGMRSKQVGHNQTFGADVNRTSIPRRTGG